MHDYRKLTSMPDYRQRRQVRADDGRDTTFYHHLHQSIPISTGDMVLMP